MRQMIRSVSLSTLALVATIAPSFASGLSTAQDGSLSSSAVTDDTGVSLEAGETEGAARARLAIGAGQNGVVAFTLSAPVDKNAKTTALIAREGLAKSTSLAGSYTRLFWGPKASAKDLYDLSLKMCSRYAQEKGLAWIPADSTAGGKPSSCCKAISDDAAKKICAEIEKCCGCEKKPSALVLTEKQCVDKATICNPIEGVEALKCNVLPLGAPGEVRTDRYVLEYRRFFLGGTLDFSPRVFYTDVDVKGTDWGIDLPLYFLRNTKGGLTGGARAIWTDNEGKLQLTVFVGKALKLWS